MKPRQLKPIEASRTKVPVFPTCDEEWQVCADVANLVLTLFLAKRYGLIKPNGQVNVGLCAKRLVEARSKGILPRNLGPGLSP